MTTIDDGLGRAINRADRLLSPLEDLLNFIAAIAVMFLMLLGVVQIALRTRWLFNAPIFGYIDMIELSMPILAVLGISYCQRHGVHIRMDILLQHLKGRLLWSIEAFASLAGTIIIGLLARYSWVFFHDAYTSGDSTTDAQLLTWPSKLLIPFALALLTIRLAIQFAGAVRMAIDPSRQPIGVVVVKDVAEQAREEIREALGEDIGASANGGAPR
ncbi:MAG TPA: TRAP transporter small permease [Thermohalobaculum sp.]|nr:TRAP transporter small permease [Thermohalobaculum sp.]